MKIIGIILLLTVGFAANPVLTCYAIVGLPVTFYAVYFLFVAHYYAKRNNYKALEWATVIIGYPLDLFLNVFYMSIIYWRLPHHWKRMTYSSRMKRSAKYDRVDGYRFWITETIYWGMMHEHDPDHNDIKTEMGKRGRNEFSYMGYMDEDTFNNGTDNDKAGL